MTEEALREERLGTELIYDGRIMRIERDTVRLPNGHEAVREAMRHVGAVCMIPLTDDGRVILERQFRYVVGGVITEIPAGKLDGPDEDPLAAARRELKEETGYEAGEWIPLGYFYSAPAYSDEKIAMFLARDLKQGERRLDEDEFLNVFTLPFEEAVRAVMAGEIPDVKTQLGILKAKEYLETQKTV